MPFSTDEEPFSFDNVAHCRDMALIGLWFMLRESEMASARECDLRLRRYALAYQYTRPTREDGSQKDRLHAAARPRYTACACGTAPERHLLRLEAHYQGAAQQQMPLFPDEGGRTASKTTFIEAIRRVIARTGTALTRLGQWTRNTTFSPPRPQDLWSSDVVQFRS